MIGHIHSIESFGTVDGPGARLVVFMQGCPMRCLYCHNPDTWKFNQGSEVTVEQLMAQYEKNRAFYNRGGITVTGGEPLMQIEFITELFTAASARGIHTCIDTSGITFQPDNPEILEQFDRLISMTDLVMLDIKHIDPDAHRKLTRQPLEPVLAFAKYLNQRAVPMWIRHVVVPGITYDQNELYRLGRFIGSLSNIKAIDIIPYHDMGKIKYKNLGLTYALEDTPPLTREETIAAKKMVLNGIRDQRADCSFFCSKA